MKPKIGQGDSGKTVIFGKPKKVWKDSSLIEACGVADELNVLLGRAGSELAEKSVSTIYLKIGEIIERIQNKLFVIQSLLVASGKYHKLTSLIDKDVDFLEATLKKIEQELPELKNFILPGGDPLACQLHLVRTKARELERRIVTFYKKIGYLSGNDEDLTHIPKHLEFVLPYINRLSDLFFAMARLVNWHEGEKEIIWKGR